MKNRHKERVTNMKNELGKRISTLTIVLLLSISLTGTMFAFVPSDVSAKTYPSTQKQDGEWTETQLSAKYWLDITSGYGAIYDDSWSVVSSMILGENDSLTCSGKYGDTFYFSRKGITKAKGVYIWKPGWNNFKLASKGLALDQFRKNQGADWFYPGEGKRIGKWVTATNAINMSWDLRKKVYLYNLETKKKKLLGKNVMGVKVRGKRYIYVRAKVGRNNSVKKLVVYSCKANGKAVKRLKKYNVPKSLYPIGVVIGTKYVTVMGNGGTKKFRYKR